MKAHSLFASTLRAVAAPRRLIPILVLCAPLVAAQWTLSTDPLAAPLGVLVCLAFVVFGPYSWLAFLPAKRRRRYWPLRLLAFLGVGAAMVVAVGYGIPRAIGMGETLLSGTSNLFIAIAFFWVGGWGLARDIELEATIHEERARGEELAREAERAQLLALRQNLDPHFLFNTLNAIAEWCRQDGEVAERATLQLSSMLRGIMEGIRAPAWSLERELELSRALFSLHAIRDPGRFRVAWELPAKLPPISVPPLLLLPIAENAMKHGPAAGHAGEVRVWVGIEADSLRIQVVNPGPFQPSSPGEGLAIVRRRLELAYEGRAQLRVQGAGDRTVADLTLPLGLSAPAVAA